MIDVHNLCKKYGEESTSFDSQDGLKFSKRTTQSLATQGVGDEAKRLPRPASVYAVDRVSFSAQSGEIFGLLGPNGAGKTTILRILSTILLPSSGAVNIAGFDVVDHPDSVRANIGYISNNTAVYDRMTAWEMVAYFGELYGLEKRELRDRMESLFERLQMNDFRDRLGEKMSTGMKQKVSIARALVHNPPVLIFDEPTIGLDVLVARSLLQMIQELRKEGKCIIFSTHIMREVERLCDRVAILNGGQILASGSVVELREQYSEPDLEELFFQLVNPQVERQHNI